MKDLFIDSYDVHWKRPVVAVEHAGVRWHFVFDPARKRAQRFSYALFFNETALTRSVYRYPRARRLAALRETPVRAVYKRHGELSRRFDRIFTFDKRLLDLGAPFVEHLNAVNWLGGWGQSGEVVEKTKNVSFMGSIQHPDQDGYSLRKQVVEYLLTQPEVDCYGKGIRPVKGKLEALESYRFSVAMENVRCDYYYTEKLVDCVLAETIPIYWGCPSIHSIMDGRGILSFESLEELKALLPQLTEARYAEMQEYAVENKRRLLTGGLATTDGYLLRLAQALADKPHAAMHGLEGSRLAAALRMLMQT